MELRDGLLTGTVVRPASNGPGKVEVMARLFSEAPFLAAGDSVHDLPMLRTAHFPVLINPRPAVHALLALERVDRWREVHLRPGPDAV